jgi:hypothetical protein
MPSIILIGIRKDSDVVPASLSDIEIIPTPEGYETTAVFVLRDLRLNVRLVPASVGAEALGLRELLALGELDANRGQHRPPVADVGAGYWGLIARFEDRAVRPVPGEYLVDARWHGSTGSLPWHR